MLVSNLTVLSLKWESSKWSGQFGQWHRDRFHGVTEEREGEAKAETQSRSWSEESIMHQFYFYSFNNIPDCYLIFSWRFFFNVCNLVVMLPVCRWTAKWLFGFSGAGTRACRLRQLLVLHEQRTGIHVLLRFRGWRCNQQVRCPQ